LDHQGYQVEKHRGEEVGVAPLITEEEEIVVKKDRNPANPN